jgi:hypothetical protein
MPAVAVVEMEIQHLLNMPVVQAVVAQVEVQPLQIQLAQQD